MRTFSLFLLIGVALTGLAMAAGEPAAGAAGAQSGASGSSALFFGAVSVAAVLALAIAAAFCGTAQGNAVARAVESIARQPESSSRILTVAMIGLAFIESLTIYVLVIALILIYANPFVAYFVK